MAYLNVAKNPTGNPMDKIHILIVDSDAKVAELLANVLIALDIRNVYTAFDANEALQLMQQQKMDMILTDWELRPSPASGHNQKHNPLIRLLAEGIPGNGAEFIRFIRGSTASPNPYACVIMLTGMALKNNVEYARDSGVSEVLVKPVTAENLCKRIMLAVDNTRPFVTAPYFRGPCRRRKKPILPEGLIERRKRDIKIIRINK